MQAVVDNEDYSAAEIVTMYRRLTKQTENLLIVAIVSWLVMVFSLLIHYAVNGKLVAHFTQEA